MHSARSISKRGEMPVAIGILRKGSLGHMNGHGRAAGLIIGFVFFSQLILGCQASGTPQHRQWNEAPIESFTSIAGKWSGIMVTAPKAREDDWVRTSISRDGRYEFASYRTIGVFTGKGQFALVNGKLSIMTERGSATGSLLVSDGARMLRFLALMKDGTEYTVELEPEK